MLVFIVLGHSHKKRASIKPALLMYSVLIIKYKNYTSKPAASVVTAPVTPNAFEPSTA